MSLRCFLRQRRKSHNALQLQRYVTEKLPAFCCSSCLSEPAGGAGDVTAGEFTLKHSDVSGQKGETQGPTGTFESVIVYLKEWTP